MKFSILLFISLFCIKIHVNAQTLIHGKIQDKSGKPIAAASIQIQDESTQLISTQTLSNQFGRFEVTLTDGKFLMHIRHLSYEAHSMNLNVQAEKSTVDTIKIVLEEVVNALDDVIILSESSVAKKINDTIRYNLEALTTGNEQKLKDVLAKLPGLEINSEGKITSNGKAIDHLLIDGKKMFGDNHQIPSENLSADMLKGVELLNNYEDFQAISAVEGSRKTALNLKIKDEYRGKLVGEAELYGAYDERYKAHTNQFFFDKRLNLSVIADANNTGQQALSLLNYLNMNKSIKQDIRNAEETLSSIISSRDVPDFLLQRDNVASKTSNFISFDGAYNPSDKLAINGFSLLDFTRVSERRLSERELFSAEQRLTFLDDIRARNRFFFNQTKLNADYKPDRRTLLNYTILFDPSSSTENRLTSTNNRQGNVNYEEGINRMNYTFGQQFSFVKRLDENSLFSTNIYHESKRTEQDYSLDGTVNLFDNDFQSLYQNKAILQNEYGAISKYTRKVDQHLFRANVGLYVSDRRFEVTDSLNAHPGKIRVSADNLFTDLSVSKNKGLFQYLLKTTLKAVRIDDGSQRTSLMQVLPFAEVKLAFSDVHHLTSSYHQRIDFPEIEQLNPVVLISNFRNRLFPSIVPYAQQFTQHILSANYFKLDLYNGRTILLNTSYTTANQAVTSNTFNRLDFNDLNYTLTDQYHRWTTNGSYEQRLPFLRSRLKIRANYYINRSANFLENQLNTYQVSNLSLRTTISSTLKDSFINYEAGFFYSFNNSFFQLLDARNRVERYAPLLNFNGRLASRYRYFIYNSYEYFLSGADRRTFYNLGIKLMHDAPKQRFKYWLEGVDMLNISSPEIIEIQTNNNNLTTNIISRIPGYLGAGISYSF